MKIVIDIPEEMYAQIIDENGIDTMLISYKDIIKNGTPLSKGHGDLIDRNELKKVINGFDYYDQVLDAPIIIEADKAESEVKDEN